MSIIHTIIIGTMVNFNGENNAHGSKTLCLTQLKHLGCQWRIHNFPGGDTNRQSGCVNILFCNFVAEKCMKMKQIWTPKGVVVGKPQERFLFALTPTDILD